MFGGNAFQVCLFLLADLVAAKPVLPSAGNENGWLAALGIALTVGLFGDLGHEHPTTVRYRRRLAASLY